MTTADVLKFVAGQAITRGLAAPVLDFSDGSQRRLSPFAPKGADLAIGDGRQLDLDCDLSRFRS